MGEKLGRTIGSGLGVASGVGAEASGVAAEAGKGGTTVEICGTCVGKGAGSNWAQANPTTHNTANVVRYGIRLIASLVPTYRHAGERGLAGPLECGARLWVGRAGPPELLRPFSIVPLVPGVALGKAPRPDPGAPTHRAGATVEPGPPGVFHNNNPIDIGVHDTLHCRAIAGWGPDSDKKILHATI